jgi:hypothetical protein
MVSSTSDGSYTQSDRCSHDDASGTFTSRQSTTRPSSRQSSDRSAPSPIATVGSTKKTYEDSYSRCESKKSWLKDPARKPSPIEQLASSFSILQDHLDNTTGLDPSTPSHRSDYGSVYNDTNRIQTHWKRARLSYTPSARDPTATPPSISQAYSNLSSAIGNKSFTADSFATDGDGSSYMNAVEDYRSAYASYRASKSGKSSRRWRSAQSKASTGKSTGTTVKGRRG